MVDIWVSHRRIWTCDCDRPHTNDQKAVSSGGNQIGRGCFKLTHGNYSPFARGLCGITPLALGMISDPDVCHDVAAEGYS